MQALFLFCGSKAPALYDPQRRLNNRKKIADLFVAAIAQQDFKLLSGRIFRIYLGIKDFCGIYHQRCYKRAQHIQLGIALAVLDFTDRLFRDARFLCKFRLGHFLTLSIPINAFAQVF